MPRVLTDLGINVYADIAELSKNVSQMKGKLGEAEGFLKSAGKAAAGYFAVDAVIAYGRAAVAAADAQAKAITKVNTAITQTGRAAGLSTVQFQKISEELASITLFSDDQILNDVTAQLLTFTNIAGENFKLAQQAALDLATVLGSDLQGTAIQLGKALNDPVKGLAALRKSGVSFTEEQQNVIKSLSETGRLAEAQTLILSELNRQYGGQATAAATAGAGGIQQFNKALGELQEEIGTYILPALTEMAEAITKIVPYIGVLFRTNKKYVDDFTLAQIEAYEAADEFGKQDQIKNITKEYDKLNTELTNLQTELSTLKNKGYFEVEAGDVERMNEINRILPALTLKYELYAGAKKELELINKSANKVDTKPIEDEEERLKRLALEAKEATDKLKGLKEANDKLLESISYFQTTSLKHMREKASSDPLAQVFLGRVEDDKKIKEQKLVDDNTINKNDPAALIASVSERIKNTNFDTGEGNLVSNIISDEDVAAFEGRVNSIVNVITGLNAAVAQMTQTFNDENANWMQKAGSVFAVIAQMTAMFITLAAAKILSKEAEKGLIGVAIGAAAIASLFAIWGAVKNKKASGGMTEGLTLVGEQGPELIDASSPSRVYSAPATKRLLGAQSTSDVVFKIKGDYLIGVSQNANKKNSYI